MPGLDIGQLEAARAGGPMPDCSSIAGAKPEVRHILQGERRRLTAWAAFQLAREQRVERS